MEMSGEEYKNILKYSFSSDIAKVNKLSNGKDASTIRVGNKNYRYNKNKPISNKLKERLNKIQTTSKYERFKLLQKGATALRANKKIKTFLTKQGAKHTEGESALNNYANQYLISRIPERMNGLKALSYLKYQKEILAKYLKEQKGMKILVDVVINFLDIETDEYIEHKIRSRRYEVLNEHELNKALDNMATDITTKLDNIQFWKSGLSVDRILSIKIHYDKYNPTRAGRYIELPKSISSKKACINIKNQDDKCFKYAVQCGVHKIYEKNHPEQMYHYKKLDDTILKWEGMTFPVDNGDLDYFEEINDGKVSINVYELTENLGINDITICRKTNTNKSDYHIDLLRIEDDDENHYVFIKDYDKLIGQQTNKHKAKVYHCKTCLHGFTTKTNLEKHLERGCMVEVGQQMEMPKEYEKISFKNHFKKEKFPFVIYGDFECLTVPEHKDPNIKTKTKTEKYQYHKPCGYMLNVVNSIDNTSQQHIYRGEDCMENFCFKLNEIRTEIEDMMKYNEPIDMSEQDEQNFRSATHCYICGDKFKSTFKDEKDRMNNKKVRDHCHFTGRYRGCAHSICNLNYCNKYFKIPVFFHNLKNYDSHFIIQNANKLSRNKDINVIAQNSEKFITFGFEHLNIKDSFSFLSSSLEKLVAISKYDDYDPLKKREEWNIRTNWQENFKHSMKSVYVKDVNDLDLLTEKGVYPYDYMNSFSKFNDTKLPPKDDFYSKLSEEHISNEDYERAEKVFNHFNLQDMGDYHDLYLTTDVLLLTDIFENFRDLCLNYYGLDPAHYYTLPNFAWDAMLLKSGVVIDMIYDEEMYSMIERGLRGGITQVSTKMAKANNPYMGNMYDENKPSSYINYLDANNLYGMAMSQNLPLKNLKWVNDMPSEEEILNYDDGSKGYILEVDLEYPKEIHDLHKDYPLAPEVMNVHTSMLSDYQMEMYRQLYSTDKKVVEAKDEKTSKLILNLNDKDKYVLHIKTLQFYLNHGLKLKKVHRCISFNQSKWLKTYIDFNTEKRKEAKTDFEKDMFKLMNNAVYGKTMEDVKKHIDFELIEDQKRYEKVVNSPTFKYTHIINENLVGVEKLRQKVKLNKPIFIGMSILDLSKNHMYGFYYDKLKPKFNDNISLIYTDTDSFVLNTITDDIYKDFKEIKDDMDLSNYPSSHKMYDKTNKKVLGKFKSEETYEITDFCGLKPKCYAYKVYTGEEYEEHKKAKGVMRSKLKKEIHFEKYERTLNENRKEETTFNAIRSQKHHIYSITQTKIALTSYCNKRYWTDAIHSVPYGHYSIGNA